MNTVSLIKSQIKGVPKGKYTLGQNKSAIELSGSFQMAKPVSNLLKNAGFKLTRRAVMGDAYTYWSKDKLGNTAKTVYNQHGSKHFSMTLKENKPLRIGPKKGKYRITSTGKKAYKRR